MFADNMTTSSKQNYWLVSPGGDFYQGQWYASLNGYIPVNNAPRPAGPAIPTSELGMTQYEFFTGNSQDDYLLQSFYTMRWGMDVSGGMLFGEDNKWGVTLGTYVYDSPHVNTIGGGRASLNYFVNDSVVLTVEERYDNVFHNQTLLGLKVSLFGKENRGTVATQLKAPIYRNLNINTTSSGSPIGSYQQLSSQSVLIQDNITFVSNSDVMQEDMMSDSMADDEFPWMESDPIAITGNGTFESPYTGLDQTILNHTTTNTTIWVEGTGVNYNNATTLSLLTGQSLYGRTTGFLLPASSTSAQPIFSFAPTAGSAGLTIGNTNTLQNLTMQGNGTDNSIGVQVDSDSSGQTAVLNGVTIGSTTLSKGYSTALYNQGGNVSITGSTLYAIQNTLSFTGGISSQIAGVFGIYNNTGSIAVNNSTVSTTVNQVNYTNTAGSGGDTVGAVGVYNSGGTMTLSDSAIQASSGQVIDNQVPVGSTRSSRIGSFGLYNTHGTMTVTNGASSIHATATGVDNQGYNDGTRQGLLDYVGAFGAYNDGGSLGNTAVLDIQQASMTASATTVTESIFSLNDPAVSAIGLWNVGDAGTSTAMIEQGATITVDSTWQITTTSSSGSAINAYGFYNQGSAENSATPGIGNVTANGVSITVTGSGGDGSAAGLIAGGVNGTILSSRAPGTAQTDIKGGTSVYVTVSNNAVPVNGLFNNSTNDAATSIIEGASIIDSEGVGASTAVYNTLGTLIIQGTAEHNVILIANGVTDESNNGVWSQNNASTTIHYATINVGSSDNGYSLGVINQDSSNMSIDQATITVSSSLQQSFGVLNSNTSTLTVSGSTLNVTTESGMAHGLWDDGSGATTITSPATSLYLNFDQNQSGSAAAFSSSGNYTGTQNVICFYNNIPSVCTTS